MATAEQKNAYENIIGLYDDADKILRLASEFPLEANNYYEEIKEFILV
jgi:hypothetical protein